MKTKIILLALLAFVGIPAIIWGVRWASAPIEGQVGAREQIQSKEMRIQAYTYFYDLYAAIKSYDEQVKILDEQLVQIKTEGERERVLATIAGLKGQRARAIQQYNADARKDYTIGQFRGWDLPYQIEK